MHNRVAQTKSSILCVTLFVTNGIIWTKKCDKSQYFNFNFVSLTCSYNIYSKIQ